MTVQIYLFKLENLDKTKIEISIVLRGGCLQGGRALDTGATTSYDDILQVLVSSWFRATFTRFGGGLKFLRCTKISGEKGFKIDHKYGLV